MSSFPAAWSIVDRARLSLVRTVAEFDELVTRRSLGFQSVDEYYLRASSSAALPHIHTPLLVLNARDDPLAPAIPIDEAMYAWIASRAVCLFRVCLCLLRGNSLFPCSLRSDLIRM